MPSNLVRYESVTPMQQNVTSKQKQYAGRFYNVSVSKKITVLVCEKIFRCIRANDQTEAHASIHSFQSHDSRGPGGQNIVPTIPANTVIP